MKYSAGNTPSTLSPYAITVTKENGINIFHPHSIDLTVFKEKEFK